VTNVTIMTPDRLSQIKKDFDCEYSLLRRECENTKVKVKIGNRGADLA
jgi:hypothetical protein